jgi:hypothetical protein
VTGGQSLFEISRGAGGALLKNGRGQDRISPFKQISLNLIKSVNATKIGFLLGIFVDAFKVGS